MKRILALSAVTLTLALSLSACGDDDKTQASGTNESGGNAQQAGGRGQGQPGSGKVAAVSGSTAQVQGTDGQTAVSWTSSTTFTKQVGAALSDVAKGSCVVIMSSSSDDDATTTSVRITEAVDGECTGGFGGGPGGPGGNGGGSGSGERPTDMPTDLPSDAPSAGANGDGGGRGGFGNLVAGKVTAVSSTGFTVDAVTMGAPGEQSDSSTAETESTTVTVSDDTTYTTTGDASSSDVKVGVCLTTRGDSDDTGAVKATSIQVAAAVDGECSTGFGGGRPGGNGSAQESE